MTDNTYNQIFKEMSFDMLRDILTYAESPRKVLPKLLEEIRELTGAKIVTIFRYNDSLKTDDEQYIMLDITPKRKKNTLSKELYIDLIKLVQHEKKIIVIKKDQYQQYWLKLLEHGFGLSIVMPVISDNHFLGSFLLLGLPTKFNLDLILQGLTSLLKIFAIIFKGSIFYMDMEEMVEERTKSLKDSREKYMNILQTTNDGFWIIDNNGNLIDVNQAYCKISGFSREELLKKSIMDIEVVEDTTTTKRQLQKVMEYQHDRFESIHKKKDETTFNVEVSISYVKTGDERNFIAFIRDITQRKKYENALTMLSSDYASLTGKQFYEAISKHIVENINLDYVFIGKLTESKQSIEVLGGYAIDMPMNELTYDLIDTPCNNVIGKNLCLYSTNVQQLFPKDELLIQMGIDGYIGSPLLKKNGNTLGIIVGLSTTPIYDEKKIIQFFSIFLESITSEILREKISIDLQESEARFKALHNASFGGITIHDQGKILECNAGLAEMTGFNIDELIGMNGLLLISEESKDMVIKNIETGYEKPYEAIGIRKDGSKYPLRLEARNIPYKGKQVRVVEFRDITEMKESEKKRIKLELQLQQSHKLEAIGTLTGGIAHDFNNMLAPIMGYADLMKYKLTSDNPYYDYAEEILSSSLKAKDLINQLLTFSRKNSDDLQPINIIPVIKSCVKFIRSSLPTSIIIDLIVPYKTVNILANSTQIHQIVMNLCINSSHAMQQNDGAIEGNITISLKKIELDQNSIKQFLKLNPGKYLQLSIVDNGKGMDEETLDHIFEPFFTTKEEGKGTGMGLSVVHGIVASHNGEIKVYSDPGKGTNFSIYFPLTDKFVIVNKDQMKLTFDQRNEKIILVDDKPEVTKLVKNMLSPFGFDITSFNDSKETFNFLSKNADNFDLLITDLTMPNLTGLDLAKKLRKQNINIPIILLTGHGFNLEKTETEIAKINTIIHKPILLEKLMTEIDKIFPKKF